MKERIRQIMEAEHMTQQQFAQHIDMAPATLSSIFNGRTKPTLNIVEAVTKKFPGINVEWLMFGSGPMMRPSSPSPSPSEATLDAPSPTPATAIEPMLDFGDEEANEPPATPKAAPAVGERLSVRATHSDTARKEVKYFDKPQRQITEIRVYFDDLTFETFVPAKK